MKALRFTVLLFALVFLSSNHAQAQISLNDVTFLLPLPKNAADLKANYFNASTFLATGSLIPTNRIKLFDWTGVEPELDLRNRTVLDRMAVLGIRLDPCFKDTFNQACRPQIRFVLQPISFTAGASTGEDVAIHLFFDTTQDQIIQLIRAAADYRNQFLGAGSARAILQVQPVITQEGIGGKFWQMMRPMILNVLNQATPSRIAFFVVAPTGRAWTFKSFDLQGFNSAAIQIPGINNTIQHLDNQIQNSTVEFMSSILPRATFGSDQTFDFLTDSARFRRSNHVSSFLVSVDRIENPNTHLPGTVDCLSCHSTPAIKHLLHQNSIGLNGTVARFISSTLPANSLFNLFEENYEANDFRLLGYRAAKAIVGQRVINESASIVDGFSR
jgi:hypothetical protein